MDYILKEIQSNYSFGQLFWGVIGGVISTLLTNFLFPNNVITNRNTVQSSKRGFNSLGQIGGFTMAFISFVLFVFIYVTKFFHSFSGNSLFSIPSLVKFFVVGSVVFICFYVFDSVVKIFKGLTNPVDFLQGLALMFFVPAFVIFLTFSVKIILEVNTGLISNVQIQNENQVLSSYWKYLISAIVISLSSFVTLEIIKGLKKSSEN